MLVMLAQCCTPMLWLVIDHPLSTTLSDVRITKQIATERVKAFFTICFLSTPTGLENLQHRPGVPSDL